MKPDPNLLKVSFCRHSDLPKPPRWQSVPIHLVQVLIDQPIGCRVHLLGILALIAIVGMSSTLIAAGTSATEQAKIIFRKRCTACHTYGKGIKVGPDLKGATERRNRDWLVRFIASSSSVIRSGDPIATKLFLDFKKERMPDWSDLSQEQICALLDYLAAAGPLQKEPDERDAITATAQEIERGRQLFHGVTRLNHGSAACDTCHSIGDGQWRDGSLGPNLSHVYFKYGDRALTDFLRHPCFAREPERSASDYLTAQELFDLKAYMAKAAGLRIPSAALSVPMPMKGGAERFSEHWSAEKP